MKFRISNFRFSNFRLPSLWLPAACLLATQIALAQAPNPPSKPPANPPAKLKGSITGQIVGDDGQPVIGAEVLAAPFTGKRQSIQVIHSDAEGRFTLTGLSEPAYQLYVRVPGFILDQSAIETPRRLGEHVTLNLTKGGVITGRVVDAAGDPLVAVRVFARRVRSLAGEAADPNAMLRFNAQDRARLTDACTSFRSTPPPATSPA